MLPAAHADRRALIARHISACLSAFGSLLAAGRVGPLDADAESTVEVTRAAAAAAQLQASTSALLDLSAQLRLEVALLEASPPS